MSDVSTGIESNLLRPLFSLEKLDFGKIEVSKENNCIQTSSYMTVIDVTLIHNLWIFIICALKEKHQNERKIINFYVTKECSSWNNAFQRWILLQRVNWWLWSKRLDESVYNILDVQHITYLFSLYRENRFSVWPSSVLCSWCIVIYHAKDLRIVISSIKYTRTNYLYLVWINIVLGKCQNWILNWIAFWSLRKWYFDVQTFWGF